MHHTHTAAVSCRTAAIIDYDCSATHPTCLMIVLHCATHLSHLGCMHFYGAPLSVGNYSKLPVDTVYVLWFCMLCTIESGIAGNGHPNHHLLCPKQLQMHGLWHFCYGISQTLILWSACLNLARIRSPLALYLLQLLSPPTQEAAWSHAWVLHGLEGCAVVFLDKV